RSNASCVWMFNFGRGGSPASVKWTGIRQSGNMVSRNAMLFEDVQFADFTCRLNTSDCLPCYSQATHSRITYGTVSARHHGRMQDEVRRTQTKREERGAARPPKHSEFYSWEAEKKVAGWVARTRPLAEPLSPRGPQ